MVSQVLRQVELEGKVVELITLSAGWGEWTHQINTYKMDGDKRLRISMANYMDGTVALRAFWSAVSLIEEQSAKVTITLETAAGVSNRQLAEILRNSMAQGEEHRVYDGEDEIVCYICDVQEVK